MKPTARSVMLSAVLLVMALVWPQGDFWAALIGVTAAAFIMDAVLGFSTPRPQARRRVQPVLPVRRRCRVGVELRNEAGRSLRLDLRDELPESFRGPAEEKNVSLAPKQALAWEYTAQPNRRGECRFGRLRCLVSSPLGLWQIRRALAEPETVRVYPDYKAIAEYLDLLADQRSRQSGLRRTQRRGEGLEFLQLRDFRDGDSIRQVDWKATAKRRSLISREYTEERDQHIVFLLDTGGRMRTKDGVLSHFDHALNALLLLAYVALRQGDTISVQTFGPSQRWIGGLRGTTAINHLLNEVYDLHSQAGAGDYVDAVQALLSRQRKRALVVLITNLHASDEDLVPAVQLLRARHVVLVASLRESALGEMANEPPDTFEQALGVAGAHRYIAARQALAARLTTSAQLVADCTPDQLPTQLVNGYWSLKRAGVL